MARNDILIHTAPARVFDVLADPRSYARWVVGSRKIRAADARWPAPDTAFDHAVGFGPLVLKDSSFVVESHRPRFLRLLVRTRPLVQAFVALRLEPEGNGTRVTMDERAADDRSRLFLNRLTDPLIHLRNDESLKRLKRLAEGEEAIPVGDLPPRGSDDEAAIKGSSTPASGRA